MSATTFENWTLLTHPSDLMQYAANNRVPETSAIPHVKSYPCLVQHFVSGNNDDQCDWVIVTMEDASKIAYLLSKAAVLLDLLNSQHK